MGQAFACCHLIKNPLEFASDLIQAGDVHMWGTGSEEIGTLLRRATQAAGQAPAVPAPGVVTGGLWGARWPAECQAAMGQVMSQRPAAATL